MPWKDPQKQNAACRKRRQQNPDHVRAIEQRSRDKHKAERRARENARRLTAPASVALAAAKARAKRDGLPFSIGPKDLVWPEYCPVLGVKLDYAFTNQNRDCRPSMDRYINEFGYVPGNVFVISQRANRIKSDATANELVAIAAYAVSPPGLINS